MFTDVPGTDYRIATISGSPDGCQRAKKWVEDLVAEVRKQTLQRKKRGGGKF